MRQSTSASSAALLHLLAAFASCAYAADDATTATATTTTTACQATSTSGAYYDLTLDVAVNKSSEHSKWESSGRTTDYFVRGYDYGANFTMNICDPVLEELEDVVGVEENLWRNVSAFYKAGGDVYSLGLSNGELTPRGKELVLQYEGGSPCGGGSSSSSKSRRGSSSSSRKSVARTPSAPVHEGAAYKPREDEVEDAVDASDGRAAYDDDDDDYDDENDDDEVRRKSAIVFFSCDKDPTAETAVVSFIATDPDECTYVFKVKSQHACAGAEPHKPGSLGPGSVFGIILGIAVLVYFLGGIFYNRTVSNARGWKQLPNYTFWAGIWSFVSDIFILAFSSCANLLPGRRGYHYLSADPSANNASRGWSNRDHADDNRLIDQLDEEWDD